MSLSYICKHCGREIKRHRFNFASTQMLLNGTCSECDYWLRATEAAKKERSNLWAINGELFELIPGENDPFEKTHLILTPDTVFSTTHLYNYGKIPERFLGCFAKKARFIKHREFKRVTARPGYICRHKGCWGRKDCWWFREETGYNEIPDDIGDNPEKCKLFIKKIK